MKKISIFLIGMIFFLGINTVSAATSYTYYMLNENYSFEENLNFFNLNKEILSKLYDGIYEDYMTNYIDVYPYYHITFSSNGACLDCTTGLYVYMYMYSDLPTLEIAPNGLPILTADYITEYEYSNGAFVLPIRESNMSKNFEVFNISYFYSNFDLILNMDVSIITKPSSKSYMFNTGDVFPVAQDLFNLDIISDYNASDSTYVEIDLNQYPYVALSLKDYTKRDTFYTNVYVKGNYCLTPVYNYGMTQKEDVLSGYKAQRCSTYYDNYTLVRTYILSQDINNNAIYYLKAYDTSKDNLVKVDTSIFDITYITEETQENPYVNITDKVYPTIAYDKLTSSATKSEDEDYVSGVVCQVGDFNCYNEYNPNNVFESLFDKPLQMLKSVWGAIITIFNLIAEFILLLPPTMQGFLYASFGISIILGIIKILL